MIRFSILTPNMNHRTLVRRSSYVPDLYIKIRETISFSSWAAEPLGLVVVAVAGVDC